MVEKKFKIFPGGGIWGGAVVAVLAVVVVPKNIPRLFVHSADESLQILNQNMLVFNTKAVL